MVLKKVTFIDDGDGEIFELEDVTHRGEKSGVMIRQGAASIYLRDDFVHPFLRMFLDEFGYEL